MQMPLALHATVLAACCGHATHLTVLVCGVADPVSAWVLHTPTCTSLMLLHDLVCCYIPQGVVDRLYPVMHEDVGSKVTSVSCHLATGCVEVALSGLIMCGSSEW